MLPTARSAEEKQASRAKFQKSRPKNTIADDCREALRRVKNGKLESTDPVFKRYRLEELSWAMRRCSSAAHVMILRQLHTRASAKLKAGKNLLALRGDGHWDESKGPTPAEQVQDAQATMVTCADAIHAYRVQTAKTFRCPVELRAAAACGGDGRSRRELGRRVHCQLNNLSFANRSAGA